MSQPDSARSVLVTGASRGIGRAIALELARRGFTVALNYRSNQAAAEATLADVHAAGSGASYLLPFDVADRAAATAALEGDIATHGVYWGVVLNAGITDDAPLPAMSGDAWDRVIHTNLDSFHNVLHPLVMPMIRKKWGGRIVTLSSVAGIAGNRGQTNYAASKAGLIAATKSLARELAKRNLTVNSVAPGLIETDMTGDLPHEEVLRTIPMRRYGKPEEVAALVGFLFSDEAAYITGQVISINGGLL